MYTDISPSRRVPGPIPYTELKVFGRSTISTNTCRIYIKNKDKKNGDEDNGFQVISDYSFNMDAQKNNL